MNIHAAYLRLVTAGLIAAGVVFASGCGNGERTVPKEETGEPNTLPVEMLLYRDARDTFLQWTSVFATEKRPAQAYGLLSAASRKQLRDRGVSDAQGFAAWFGQQASANIAPFAYVFSRFDILDIDLQDSMRAIITATFLVHHHQNTFESVGSFILRRERGKWVVPFAESGNFESSWWEKEKRFAMRLREEGLTRLSSDALSISLKYPVAWDVTNSKSTFVPTQPAALPGLELQYIDPATLSPIAFARVAVISGPLPDSLHTHDDTTAPAPLRMLRSERVSSDRGRAVEGEVRWIADPARDRYLLFYTAVDASLASYDRFAETFAAIRTSLLTTNEDLP
jgi:hypothetical protein